MMSESEGKQILTQSCGPALEFPHEQCIHEMFEAQAEKRPEAPAAWFENQELTYSEVNRRANQLAHFLRGIDVGPDVPVGICIERSLDILVSILGVLKAGGCYVPLDPSYPADRLAFLVSDSKVPLLLTSSQLLPTLPATNAWIRSGRKLQSSQSTIRDRVLPHAIWRTLFIPPARQVGPKARWSNIADCAMWQKHKQLFSSWKLKTVCCSLHR